jgi:methylglutaconyl-CoA hydratase
MLIETERRGAVAWVWLNRPEAHNALTPELGAALVEALDALAKDASCRVVVLGGRGPSFCAGADIATMKASANASMEANLADAKRFGEWFAAVAEFPKPVVARLHGGVFGGGVGLACAADIAVAEAGAKFALTEVRLGIIPGLISPYVIRRLGDRIARELMLTGERLGGDMALHLGLIHHLTPEAGLDAKVDERVTELLKGAPGAQARIKRLLANWANTPWDEYRDQLPRALAEVRATDEAKDGLSAFFEKRKPGWMK